MRYYAISIFLATLVAQFFYSRAYTIRPAVPLASLPPEIVSKIDLGLHSAMASLLWIKITQDVYTWLDGSGGETLATDIRTINTLDPKWSYPYAFGAILLPNLGSTPEKKIANSRDALLIGEAGLRTAEPDWRIAYFLAVAHHNAKDRANAAKNFDRAAHTTGAPENIKTVASTYGTGDNAREETRRIWQAIAESSRDPDLRDRALQYIAAIEYLEKIEVGKKLEKKK